MAIKKLVNGGHKIYRAYISLILLPLFTQILHTVLNLHYQTSLTAKIVI